MTAERPVSVLIAAMGGEGGGVLAGWLIKTAEHAGLTVQATSIPTNVALNDGGQVAFLAQLEDEPWALFVATPTLTFDENADGSVNVFDYGAFEECLTGPDGITTSDCVVFDANKDCRVDMVDYFAFQDVLEAPQ